MTQPQTDRLIEDYLGAVSYACADLPPDRRDDLITDLREHITAARAVLYQPTEAAIRTILDRLGEPSAIAEEALLGEPRSQRAAPPPRVDSRHRSTTTKLAMVLGFVLAIFIILLLVTFQIRP